MREFIRGIDPAKRKFDAAPLANGKLKHKAFANGEEGFSELAMWLKKRNVDHTRVHGGIEYLW